ncbi:Hypothetical predicted protein [Marmota monax]|uniref:Uncharacterized protein n=1 Tax=Marmota monax TaxID=9995 RepID=A0A5E4CCP9_MARMO|nr:hypothetical protein GHT09_009230 [Marmota monax]VTJ79707.1 Hypothetical predicted protein [Marmota monax]
MQILPDGPKSDVDFSEILNAIQEMAKDVNILFDELEAVNSPCKDDDSLLHPGNLTSTSDDASRLETGGETSSVQPPELQQEAAEESSACRAVVLPSAELTVAWQVGC